MNDCTMNKNEKLQALHACPAFASIPKDQIGFFAEMMEVDFFKKGEVVFQKGEPADHVAVLVSGELSVYLESDIRIETLKPNAVLGEYGMFFNSRTSTVKADTDTYLLTMDYRRFHALLMEFPESMLVLFKQTVQRLVEVESRLK